MSIVPGVSINHVSIAVPDIDAAIAWYEEVFGMTLDRRAEFNSPHLTGTVAFVAMPGIRIELWSLADAAETPAERRKPNTDLKTCGTKHLALNVPDLGTTLVRLARAGKDIVATQPARGIPMQDFVIPGPDVERVDAYAAFIRDPGGALIELLDAAPPARMLAA